MQLSSKGKLSDSEVLEVLVQKTKFDMKQPLRVILGHSFCNQLQSGSGLLITK